MTSTLRVDTIKNVSGTTALTIDSSGRVLKPVIPSFMVSRNATWEALSTGDVVAFNTDSGGQLFNNGGHFNTTTNGFVAPVAGLYSFSTTIYTANSDTVNAFAPYLNGATVKLIGGGGLYMQQGESTAMDNTTVSTFLLNLSVNDTVKIHAITGSDIYGSACMFCGHLVG